MRCLIARLPDTIALGGVSLNMKGPFIMSSNKILIVIRVFIAAFHNAMKAINTQLSLKGTEIGMTEPAVKTEGFDENR
jgi:hypothetical protein